MKKTLVFLAIILGLHAPVYGASEYALCKSNITQKYTFDMDDSKKNAEPMYKEIYQGKFDAAKKKHQVWLETTHQKDTSGYCTIGYSRTDYTCKAGQKNRECVPQVCWRVYDGTEGASAMILKEEATKEFIEKKVLADCGEAPQEEKADTASDTDSKANKKATAADKKKNADKNKKQTKATTAAPSTVTGTVVDDKGKPLGNANIIVPGTSIGTAAAANGTFTLNKVPADATQIQISYVGYATQTIAIKANVGRIKMVEQAQKIDPVVVTSCTKVVGEKSAEYNEGFKKCIPTACEEPRYVLEKAGTKKAKCADQNGEKCTRTGVANATKFVYRWENGKLECVVDDCKNKYRPSDDKQSCVQVKGECTPTDDENALKGEMKNGKCTTYKCKDGYTVSKDDGKCVAITKEEGTHADGDPDGENADGESDDSTDTDAGKDASKDAAQVDKKYTQEEMDALRENYDNMKAKEQSTANKLIGAAGIGATGIGGMMAASAMAEQQADEAAERDMKAYLETMRCDYGRGMNIRGGDTGIELPGGNDLAQLHIEYALLVESLTEAKAALGMTPGIEAEATIDKADTGLYDNAAIGKTGGAYFSIARALQDPQGTDAKEWEEQKAAAKKKLKTGAIVAGVGAAGSLVANVIANARAPKENSKAILGDHDKRIDAAQNVLDTVATARTAKDTPVAKDDEADDTPVADEAPNAGDVAADLSDAGDDSVGEKASDDAMVVLAIGDAADDKFVYVGDYAVLKSDADTCSKCMRDGTTIPRGPGEGFVQLKSGSAQESTFTDTQKASMAKIETLCAQKGGTWLVRKEAQLIDGCCYTYQRHYCDFKRALGDNDCKNMFAGTAQAQSVGYSQGISRDDNFQACYFSTEK